MRSFNESACDEGEQLFRTNGVTNEIGKWQLSLQSSAGGRLAYNRSGLAASGRIIEAVRSRSRNGTSLRDLVKAEIRRIFAAVDQPVVVTNRPRVTLIVGVNGTGKTTTVGKLANRLKNDGELQSEASCSRSFRSCRNNQLRPFRCFSGS